MKNLHQAVVLIILDGWGIAPKSKHNAISLAKTPNFEHIAKEFGSIQICASGRCVGLTEGQMGNSEVGHLTIGAGRAVFQDLMRVTEEIETGRLAKNPVLVNSIRNVAKRDRKFHLIGLTSDGGVHSHINHLFSLLKIARENGEKNTFVHVILDGRDTPPMSGASFVSLLQENMDEWKIGTIATVSGRYYAMDRDNRWDRTKLAYDAIVYGIGEKYANAASSIAKSYEEGTTDEFVIPKVIGSYSGLSEGDLVVLYNFRPDRMRQLTKALSFDDSEFSFFDRNRERRPKNVDIISMTIYDDSFKQVRPLLGRERVSNTLANILEEHSVKQLRIAETEKYAHVTYFFNGLIEKPMKLENRILVPSLKVGTYDKRPEMSAQEIARKAVKKIESKEYGFILINFANADMVGHSGKVEATIKGVETVDECLGEIVDTWRARSRDSSTLIVTADHGNAEKLYDESSKQAHTAHTSNPVPFIVVSDRWKVRQDIPDPSLQDVASTILGIMGIVQSSDMTGRCLVSPK